MKFLLLREWARSKVPADAKNWTTKVEGKKGSEKPIYVRKREQCSEIANFLNQQQRPHIRCVPYHAGMSKEERKQLGTGNASGQRTDTIMLLHIGSGPNLLMSIPRDSIVPIPGHGETKINAAFAYGGPQLLVQTVENATGIRVDHYVEIGFGGFVNAVDAVGGVEICPTQAMKDPLANLDIPKGCQQADGITALGYSRSRHVYADSDFTRVLHQREVVSAVGHEAVSPWSVINPVRYWRLNMAMDSLRVSEGTGPIALGRMAWAMTHVTGKDGLSCTVPVADSAIHWDTERARQLFKRIIADDTAHVGKSLCTPKGIAG